MQDLIALFGGGERVGEMALEQTLDMATGALSSQPGTAGPVPGSNSDERAPEVNHGLAPHFSPGIPVAALRLITRNEVSRA